MVVAPASTTRDHQPLPSSTVYRAGARNFGFVGGAPPDSDLEMGAVELRLHLDGLPEADDNIVDVLAVEIPERVLDARCVGVDDGGRVGVLLIAGGSVDLRGRELAEDALRLLVGEIAIENRPPLAQCQLSL